MYRKEIRQLLTQLAWADDVSYYHSLRVGYYLSKFAETEDGKKFVKQAWVTRNECVASGLLHDIGKVGWPREILLSAQLLKDMDAKTLAEFWYYQIDHPLAAQRRILEFYQHTGNRFWERIAQGVAAHHEDFEGGGYPLGLTGHEIPLLARGLRTVDSFVGMTEKRRHRDPFKADEIGRKLRSGIGCLFDPFWGVAILRFLEQAEPCPDLDVWLEAELGGHV